LIRSTRGSITSPLTQTEPMTGSSFPVGMNISLIIGLFLVFALIIAFAGYKLVQVAERLSNLTGIGEALFGGILLGAITSLAGIITSVTAAWQAHPELAMSNAIGGIAAQTLFLSVADIFYRKANLEHSSASFTNLLMGLLLVFMLSFILLVIFGPDLSIWKIHPASIILLGVYVIGNRVIKQAEKAPMWFPKDTQETVEDTPDPGKENRSKLPSLWARFMVLAGIVGFSGYMIANYGLQLSEATGLSEGLVGSLFTAVITSFPELIVTIAAVRQGALTMAVANIIGGNSFDVLFVSFSDFAYREGSIFHAIGNEQIFVLILTLLLTTVLISGLLIRQKEGIVKIGWESALIILIFLGGYTLLYI